MTKQTEPGTPWTLHLDRDGTEDFLIVRDTGGSSLPAVTSSGSPWKKMNLSRRRSPPSG